jgi:hypothetical protein
MSEIKVDTLTGKTTAGDITVTSEGGAATMPLQQGLVKTWINLNMVSFGVNDSLGISSATDEATGVFAASFTNLYNNILYCSAGSTIGSTVAWSGVTYVSNGDGNEALTTSGYEASARDSYNGNALIDMNPISVLNTGDLA